MISPTFDTVVYLLNNCSDVDSGCVAGYDSGGAGVEDAFTWNVTSTGTYYIIADGYYSTDWGSYTLNVTITGDACGNASCDGGETTCSCPTDCGEFCGDGCCNGSETLGSCPVDCACPLPYSIGTFNTNLDGWTAPAANWIWDSTQVMEFYWSPSTTSYSYPSTSPQFDLGGCSVAYVNYDLFFSDYSGSGQEKMRVQCSGNGSAYTDLAEYANLGDIPWTSYSHALPVACRTSTATIRFRALGDDSFDINWWYIDNVTISSF